MAERLSPLADEKSKQQLITHPRLSCVVAVPSTHSDRTVLFMFLNKETLPILQDIMILIPVRGVFEIQNKPEIS